MTFLFGLVGLFGCIFGVAMFAAGTSDTHGIFGTLWIGFGVLILAVAVLVDRVKEGNDLLRKLVEK